MTAQRPSDIRNESQSTPADVDATALQPLVHHRTKIAVRRRLAAPADRGGHGLAGDVVSLGQHRSRETLDPVRRDARHSGHVGEVLARADPSLDLARTQYAFHLDLQLSEPRPIASQRCAQPVVGRDGQFLTRIGGDDDGPAVGAQSTSRAARMDTDASSRVLGVNLLCRQRPGRESTRPNRRRLALPALPDPHVVDVHRLRRCDPRTRDPEVEDQIVGPAGDAPRLRAHPHAVVVEGGPTGGPVDPEAMPSAGRACSSARPADSRRWNRSSPFPSGNAKPRRRRTGIP